MTDAETSDSQQEIEGSSRPFVSDDEILLRRVSKELKDAEERKTHPLKQIGALLVSLFLFISFGLFSGSVSGIVLLVVVVLIHETGHYIGMKLLKYKDVRMFFIPLLGAAVSGTATAPSGIKKAVVSLMGPLPGILIGIVTAIIYIKTKEPVLAAATRTFLFINVFNLLPFHPLDGGRFFDAILFSRHPRLELIFKSITTLALGGTALLLQAPLLGLFTLFTLLSLKSTYAVSKVAYQYKSRVPEAELNRNQAVPEEHLRMLLPAVRKLIPADKPAPKMIALQISGIWQRIQNRPASAGASVGMLLGYTVFLLLGITSFFLFTWIAYAVESRTTDIITKSGPDGRQIRVYSMSIGGNPYSQIELNEEDFFHGRQVNWHLFSTNISKTGQWADGFREGEFLLFDSGGQLTEIIDYDRGTPIRYRRIRMAQTNEVPEVEWDQKSRFFQPQELPEKAEPVPEP